MPRDSGPLYTTNPDVSLGGPEWRVLEGVTWGSKRARRRVLVGSGGGRHCGSWGHTRDWGVGRSLVSSHGGARPALQRPPSERQRGLPAAAAGLRGPGLPARSHRPRPGPAAGRPPCAQQPRRESSARTVRSRWGGPVKPAGR